MQIVMYRGRTYKLAARKISFKLPNFSVCIVRGGVGSACNTCSCDAQLLLRALRVYPVSFVDAHAQLFMGTYANCTLLD
jgi:hypothetical protein